MRLLADENLPHEVVAALRRGGHDVAWVREQMPGSSDQRLLEKAQAEQRIVLTFDKDFGELAFHRGLPATCGVILFRIPTRSPAQTTVLILGRSREVVEELQRGARPFDDDVIQTIRRDGSYDVDEETEQGLRSIGWAYLARAPCGRGQLRGVPSGSVSYVSALCGFLMAGEYIAEVAGLPILESPLYRWEWDHVLTVPPSLAGRVAVDPVASCLERHELRSEIYRSRWNTSRSA